MECIASYNGARLHSILSYRTLPNSEKPTRSRRHPDQVISPVPSKRGNSSGSIPDYGCAGNARN
jgi:hypothetical protein